MDKHEPVLLTETLAGLAVVGDGCYVDGTYGRGGHSAEILARLGPEGRLLALDKDPSAVADGVQRFGDDKRFEIRHAGFEQLRANVEAHFGVRQLAGVLLDLGVSSPQLESAERGFSFLRDGPLDMRMNTTAGITAAQWLQTTSTAELARVFSQYGEEPRARKLAKVIIEARDRRPITTTAQLANIVAAVVPRGKGKTHPATRAFQAIRIAVNAELDALEHGLADSVEALATDGRLVVISFHSLEDRIVKRFIARESRGDPVYAGLPEIPLHARARLAPVGRLNKPSAAEIERNPRARSARLRIARKLDPGAEA